VRACTQSAGVAGALSEDESAQLFDTWAIHSPAQASIQRSRILNTLTDRPMRRILLVYGPTSPWSFPGALPPMADRYRAMGFTEIVGYAPRPQERAVRHPAGRPQVLTAPPPLPAGIPARATASALSSDDASVDPDGLAVDPVAGRAGEEGNGRRDVGWRA
jgi:hypothetical protein